MDLRLRPWRATLQSAQHFAGVQQTGQCLHRPGKSSEHQHLFFCFASRFDAFHGGANGRGVEQGGIAISGEGSNNALLPPFGALEALVVARVRCRRRVRRHDSAVVSMLRAVERIVILDLVEQAGNPVTVADRQAQALGDAPPVLSDSLDKNTDSASAAQMARFHGKPSVAGSTTISSSTFR